MRCTNVYLMPDFYMHVPHMPGAQDYVDAANSYLSHRMLYSSCYPTRPLGQALEDFRRLPILPGIESLTVFSDYDQVGLAAAKAVGQRYQGAARNANLLRPKRIGEDFNDVMMRHA